MKSSVVLQGLAAACLAVHAPALVSQNAIQLFSPANVRFSTEGAGSGAAAVTFNATNLSLTCTAPITAKLSSSPSGTGNVLVDNYISLGIAEETPVNICSGGTVNNGYQQNCFNYSGYGSAASAGEATGQDPDIYLADGGVPPIDISSRLHPGANQVHIGLVDTGYYLAGSSLYLVTSCTPNGASGPANVIGNPIPTINPSDSQLKQKYSFNSFGGQRVGFTYDLSEAQSSGQLSIATGTVPSTADTTLDPATFQSKYLKGTSFANGSCLIHTGELYGNAPACKLYTLTCQAGIKPAQSGVLCPASRSANEIFQDDFDGPSFTLPDVAGLHGGTFHQGVGFLEAKEGWTGGTCMFDPASVIAGELCPQNVLTTFSGGGYYESGGRGQGPDSTFITVAPVPEDLTTVTVTGQRPGYWINSHSAAVQFVSTPPAVASSNDFIAAPVRSLTYGISSASSVPQPGAPAPDDIVVDNSACPAPGQADSPAAAPFAPSMQDISVHEDGYYALHYFAQDCAGTKELRFTETAGRWSTSFYTFPVNVDTVAPVVSEPALPSGSHSYSVGQKVLATFRCQDALSGIVQCGTSTYAPGATQDTGELTAAINTSTAGPQTFAVNGVDAAGNRSSASVSYTVVSSTVSPPLGGVSATGGALVIGSAQGVVYSSLSRQYKITVGTGNEDPSRYDLVVFDGSKVTPQAIAANPAVQHFIAAGKAVMILNNTDEDLSIGLKGILWGHVSNSSSGAIFYVERYGKGKSPLEVDMEFPRHVTASILATTATPRAATEAELSQDASDFVASFKHRFGSGSDNITPPESGLGTTIWSYDLVQPTTISMPSAYTEISPSQFFEWCDDVPLSSFGVWGACEPHTNPTTTDNAITASFETLVNVLLEPSGPQTYLHKVLARQYAYVSVNAWPPNSNWETSVLQADAANGTNNPNGTETTMLGFNAAVQLGAFPTWSGVSGNPPMAVTETQPVAANNTSMLTTSEEQNETVGISVSGGYQGGGFGILGANWSDSWTWGTANTINITDWSSSSSTVGGNPPFVQYLFAATGNTPNTYADLLAAGIGGNPSNGYNPPQYTGLQLGPQTLNGLQSSGVVSQSETVWKSSGGLVLPAWQKFYSYAYADIGEVYQYFDDQLNTWNYGNVGSALIDEPIMIDFSNPSLQPPTAAPWTLSFGPYTQQNSNYQLIKGTVSLPQKASTATTIYLSYVVQPEAPMLTLPTSEVCPGNTSSFAPGNDVVNNGNPPLSITIPANETSVDFSLSFEVFNSSTYNVQVVAWLPSTTMNGTAVNPQSAVCLTPPNT